MTESPDRLRRLRELFDGAMDLPPTARDDYLRRETNGDDALRREVEALVTAESTATDGRLASPVARALGSAADAAAAGDGSLVGRRLGPYDVVRLVGLGGMGAVYEAVRADDQYRKRVAVKVVQGGLASDVTLARFRRERQILAGLEHPNIATLLDGGVTPDGRPFLVLEYVDGEPITRWCDARALGTRARVALFRQVCAAVRHAHRNLVVHRDLKPGNVLVTAEGAVKLLDFGIARLLGGEGAGELPLTRADARAFTPEYASPEQVRGDALTTASDVYSLGVVLFELLAGRRPHTPASRAAADVERAVLAEPVPRPSAVVTDPALRRRLRGELDPIVLAALRAEPERRYASVDALDDDLRRYLEGRPIAARRDSAGYRLRKFVLRNVAAVTAAALVLVALVGGVVATSVEARRARAEQARAERVSGFLRDLLSSVRPGTGRRDVAVSEVLDSAARRVRTELATQPATRAELETVIGQSYQALGRYDEAAPHLAEALALQTRLEGAKNPRTIAALVRVAELQVARGEYDRADSILHRALALARARSEGPDSTVAAIYGSLGSAANNSGKHRDAERYHRDAWAIERQIWGDRDDRVAYSMNNVAVALGQQNKWAAAESLHRATVSILRANHPGPHPLVADALNGLAGALDLQGKTAAAESAYVEVIAQRRQLLGPEHPDYAFTVFNYAMFVYDQGRYDEALARSREVLALRGRTLPESHPSVAAALQTVGRCLDKLGDVAGGGRALEESLALRRKYLPADSWLVSNSESVLGEHYLLAKDYARAEALLLRGHEGLMRAFGAADMRTQASLRRLVSLYETTGRAAKAAPYQALLKSS